MTGDCRIFLVSGKLLDPLFDGFRRVFLMAFSWPTIVITSVNFTEGGAVEMQVAVDIRCLCMPGFDSGGDPSRWHGSPDSCRLSPDGVSAGTDPSGLGHLQLSAVRKRCIFSDQ